MTIADGAALDISGDATTDDLNFGQKQFTIAGTGGVGGTGAILNSTVRQLNAFQRVALSADALVNAAVRMDIRAPDNGDVLPNTGSLDLAGKTLTKIGADGFINVNVDVSAGDIIVNQGIFSFEGRTKVLAVNKPNGQPSTVTLNDGSTLQVYTTSPNLMSVTRAHYYQWQCHL